MLTLKLIRDDKDFVINRLKIKNFDATELVEKIIACDDRRKECCFGFHILFVWCSFFRQD